MNYTTYLFDFDYTLADSSRGIVTCFQNVLNRYGYTQVTEESIKRTIGKTLEESFSILTGVTDPGQLADFRKAYGKEANVHMTVNTVLFLETKSVLTALKDAGAHIGIISTKYRYRIKELLDLHFPSDFMDILIGGEDVKVAKPSPEGLLLAIKQLKVSKAETLYIGDSTVDAKAAQAAGIDFAGILHGVTTAKELSKYPHRKIMNNLEELLNHADHETGKNTLKESDSPKLSFSYIPQKLLADKNVSSWLSFGKTRLRALHIRQIHGKSIPPANEEPCTCLNCGTTYTGNYCNRCGQSRRTSRYRLSNALKNILGGLTNIDNGFGRTLLDLLYRPGYMIRDFIGGKRRLYFRPFQTLFILAALYIIAVQLIDPEALTHRQQAKNKEKIEAARDSLQKRMEQADTEEEKQALSISINSFEKGLEISSQTTARPKQTNAEVKSDDDDFMDSLLRDGSAIADEIKQSFQHSPFLTKLWNLLKNWGHGNKAFHIIATLPFFALATQMAFRRKKQKSRYNLTEQVFIQAYIACQILLLSIIALFINGHAKIDELYEIPLWLIFVLFFWDYKQLYRYSWWKSLWRTTGMFIYSLLLILILSIIIALAAIAGIYIWKLF